jgi:hypothetical protein
MAEQRYKKHIKTDEFPDNTHIEISVYYNKGNMSYLSGQSITRGFYLSATPVKIAKGMISFTLFSGVSKFILPVKRFSDKQFNIAVEKSKDYEDEVIAALRAKNRSA